MNDIYQVEEEATVPSSIIETQESGQNGAPPGAAALSSNPIWSFVDRSEISADLNSGHLIDHGPIHMGTIAGHYVAISGHFDDDGKLKNYSWTSEDAINWTQGNLHDMPSLNGSHERISGLRYYRDALYAGDVYANIDGDRVIAFTRDGLDWRTETLQAGEARSIGFSVAGSAFCETETTRLENSREVHLVRACMSGTCGTEVATYDGSESLLAKSMIDKVQIVQVIAIVDSTVVVGGYGYPDDDFPEDSCVQGADESEQMPGFVISHDAGQSWTDFQPYPSSESGTDIVDATGATSTSHRIVLVGRKFSDNGEESAVVITLKSGEIEWSVSPLETVVQPFEIGEPVGVADSVLVPIEAVDDQGTYLSGLYLGNYGNQ